MRTISYKLDDLKKIVIPIGFEGENDHTRVIIDAGEVFAQYPSAAASLRVKPPQGSIYPVVVNRDGDKVIWNVKDTDCASDGNGEAQFTFTENHVIVKSVVTKIKINRSLKATGPAPDPIEDWLDTAEDVLEEVQVAEVNQPTIGEDGYWYTWDQENGEYEKTNTKAQGADGHSPVLTSSKDGKITTLYADGEQIAQIQDGEDGQGADVIDDTSGEGDTDKTWSADKLTDEFGDVLTAIQGKPSVKSTDKQGVDLDITDVSGDVLVRFENGHVKTKKFNSENVDEVVETSKESDLDITDPSGNVIARLENGHIRTKYFESRVRSRMKFGAHNGAEYYAPECTVPAYRIAGQQGWEYAWIAGIDFSTDGTMYVIHDDTVDRTTDGTGYLNEMSDAEINALNIDITGDGYSLSDFDPSELKIPTLEQVVQQCVRYDMKMVMRLHLFPKNYDTAANMAKWDGLLEIINGYGIQPENISCYVGTGDHAITCRTLIGEGVEISTFLGNAATAQDFIDWFDERSITGRKAAIISISNVDANAVKLLHSNGIRVYAFGYNPSDTVVSNMANLGVDVLQNGKAHKLIY